MLETNPMKRGRQGFTLFELIVVISILGVITNMGIVAFSQITTAWADTKAEADLDHQVDAVFEDFQEDISDTLSATLSGEAILGSKREATSSLYFDRVLADDMIVLPIQHSAAGVRMRTGSKVAWRVSREGDITSLVRAIGELNEEKPSGPTEDKLGVANVVRLSFEYQSAESPGVWTREWNSAAHPTAVKMNLVAADRGRPWVQIGREAVFPINVR